jgi:hypothetical protein
MNNWTFKVKCMEFHGPIKLSPPGDRAQWAKEQFISATTIIFILFIYYYYYFYELSAVVQIQLLVGSNKQESTV